MKSSILRWEPDIIIKYVTDDMKEWLKENYNEDKYYISPHMVRFRYAGPTVPIDECQRQEGWEIYFDDASMAVAFKLRFTE